MSAGNARSEKLRMALISALPRLAAISEDAAGRDRGAGKWVKKEIMGHLIDSATNNHQRFVRAQLTDRLQFPGYEQDAWVRVQAYKSRPWIELVALWEHLNRNLVHIMATFPPSHLTTECVIGGGEPHTVEFLMLDYTDHMQHHLTQIFAE